MSSQLSEISGNRAVLSAPDDWKPIKAALKKKQVRIALLIVFLVVFATIFGHQIVPQNPYQINPADSLHVPGTSYLLGADFQGRDVLSRIVFGSRSALLASLAAVFCAGVAGVLLGFFSARRRGVFGITIMRVLNAMDGMLMFLVALLIALALGGGLLKVILALAVSAIPVYANIMNTRTLSARDDHNSSFESILTSAMPLITTAAVLQLGALIFFESILGYLDIGIVSPGVSWGSMIGEGQKFLLTRPLLFVAPAICLILIVLAFKIIGLNLRNTFEAEKDS